MEDLIIIKHLNWLFYKLDVIVKNLITWIFTLVRSFINERKDETQKKHCFASRSNG